MRKLHAAIGSGLVICSLLAFTQLSANQGARKATLLDANGQKIGELKFQHSSDGVVVSVSVNNVIPGFHGMHLHANAAGLGCVAPAFTSVGGHFSAAGTHHGDHTGDMPPVLVNHDGTGSMSFVTEHFTLTDIENKAVILHALPDNLRNIPVGTAPNQYTANSVAATDLTAATGNAGARIGCGIIQ